MKYPYLLILMIFVSNENIQKNEVPIVAVEKENIRKKVLLKVGYSVYNAVPNQTDNSPLITANLSKIDTHKLNKGLIKWIAVSKDLLKKYPYNTKLKITGSGKFDNIWTVKDRMNKRFKNRIDFLLPSNQKLGKDSCYIEIL